MSRRPIRSNKTCRLTLEALESRLAPSVYYVSPTGSDNNPGTVSSPFQTIQHAADLVNPGDTVLVNDGDYVKPTAPGAYSNYTSGYTAVVTVWRSGTANNLITFKSINQYGAKIDGQNNTTFSGFMFANQVGFIRVEGFDFFGECDYNLSVPQGDAFDIYNGGHDLQIVGNNIHNIGNFATDTADGLNGIFIGNNYLDTIPSGNNILIQGNLIHDIGRTGPGPLNTPYYENHDHGIYIHEGSNVTIINNVFYNNQHGWDIQLYPNPISGLNILNNTFAFYNPWRNGQIIVSGALSNSNIENNIFYQPCQPGGISGVSSALEIEDNKSITTTLVSNNLIYGGTITNISYSGITFVNNLENTDPLFVNSSPSSFDFRLQAGSPAINAGLSLPLVTNDFYGTSRPQGLGYDIGAYELPGSSGVTTHLQIGIGSSTTAGSSFSITVTALNASNNISSGYTGTVQFSSSDAAAILPASYTFTAADAGVHTFTGVILKTAGSRSITAADTLTGSITGSASVTVNPAAASTHIVTGYPSPTTAGTSHNFTVTARDAYGNTATGYTGTVTFSSTDTKVILPANYTFTSADAGVHIFSATLKIAGSQSITVKDTVTSSIVGSQTGITVNPAAANHLVISRFPSKTTAGAAQNFRVTVQDLYGNTATSYAGTVAFSSSDSQAILPANYTFAATDAGIHTFSSTLKTAGSQSLTAKDTANAGVASSTRSGITVNPATTSQLQVSGFPISLIVGTAANFTVTAKDPYGNTTPAYVGTVTFSSSDSQAVLPSSYTFTSTDAGAHTFSATLKTTSTQSISATDTASASITGSQTGISVVAVEPTPTISGPSSGVPGQPLTFTLGASESGLPTGTVYSYSVQWGDGSSVQTFSGPSGTQATHGFLTTGVVTITVTATDPKGNLSSPVSTSVSLSRSLMETDPSNSSLTALYIGGTTGDDNIAITPVAGGGVKVGMNFVNYGSFSPTGHVIVYGLSGNDIIKTAAQTINGVLTYVSVSVMFFGGSGNDVLNLSGSSANNVVVGGGGTDRLIGGQGRDLLIGGAGQSTLQAGAGGDILIGGTTTYDNNAAALAAVLAEWSRTDIDYTTRIAHLTGSMSGGLNGSYVLNGSTIHGNGLADNLYGGSSMDWFFAGMTDVLFNKTSGEVVTSI